MSDIKDNQGPLWEVFVQSKNNLPYKHAGSVHAFDKEMAIQNARDLYTRRGEGRAIWVVPAEAIVSSSPGDEAHSLIRLTTKYTGIQHFMKCLKALKTCNHGRS